MALLIDRETKEAVPVTAFLNGDGIAQDVARINDAGRGRFLAVFGMALALARNYNPFTAPKHFKLTDLLKKFDKTLVARKKAYRKNGEVSGNRPVGVNKKHPQAWRTLLCNSGTVLRRSITYVCTV